jgi:hypothetical protein
MIAAILASVLLAAVSTLGDFVWAHWSIRHRMVYGLIHGAVICLSIGAVVGWRAGRPAAGALVGPVVGVAAAGAFYLLASTLGWLAMLPAWMLFWICFAILQARLDRDRALGPALVRGVVAALLSGVAFYLVSGMWTNPPRGDPHYAGNFLRWAVAFLPGFLALFVPRPRS